MKRFLGYNEKLENRAKNMRKEMTKAEKKLRFDFLKKLDSESKKSPLNKGGETALLSRGIRVLKQRPIDNFIVDFYIPNLKLVIEVDWDTHFSDEAKVYDEERTKILEWLWLQVLRFTNNDVLNNFDGVCEKLRVVFYLTHNGQEII